VTGEPAFILPAIPPFRLDLTVWALRRRPSNRTDCWDGQVYRRVLPAGPDLQPVLVAVEQVPGDAEAPRLQVTLSGPGAGGAAEHQVRTGLDHLLGLRVNLHPFYDLAGRDPVLGPLARRFRGVKPPRFPSLFEALVNAIANQQVSLDVGILLLNRLAETYGRGREIADRCNGEDAGPGAGAFPLPEDLAAATPDALRGLGFSYQKARALLALAEAAAGGQLSTDALAPLDNAQAVAYLRELRGTGRWSAEYALLRGLGRLDVFPGDDVGAAKRLQQWLGRPEKLAYDEVRRATARWQPYSGLVYFHLLLDSLHERGVLEP